MLLHLRVPGQRRRPHAHDLARRRAHLEPTVSGRRHRAALGRHDQRILDRRSRRLRVVRDEELLEPAVRRLDDQVQALRDALVRRPPAFQHRLRQRARPVHRGDHTGLGVRHRRQLDRSVVSDLDGTGDLQPRDRGDRAHHPVLAGLEREVDLRPVLLRGAVTAGPHPHRTRPLLRRPLPVRQRPHRTGLRALGQVLHGRAGKSRVHHRGPGVRGGPRHECRVHRRGFGGGLRREGRGDRRRRERDHSHAQRDRPREGGDRRPPRTRNTRERHQERHREPARSVTARTSAHRKPKPTPPAGRPQPGSQRAHNQRRCTDHSARRESCATVPLGRRSRDAPLRQRPAARATSCVSTRCP